MLFVVLEAHGAAWDYSRPLREQALWTEHAAFMDALEAEGFVALGGPLRHGALLIVKADGEAQVRATLAEDPWEQAAMLSIESVEPWQILLGHLPGADETGPTAGSST